MEVMGLMLGEFIDDYTIVVSKKQIRVISLAVVCACVLCKICE
jgi:hypothetical protein